MMVGSLHGDEMCGMLGICSCVGKFSVDVWLVVAMKDWMGVVWNEDVRIGEIGWIVGCDVGE